MPSPEFYELGDPLSFGKPIKPLGVDDLRNLAEFVEKYNPDTHPENYQRLARGQAPEFKFLFQRFSRDRFLSMFTDTESGTAFVLRYAPLVMEKFGVETGRDEITYEDILLDFWERDDAAVSGGLETQYYLLRKPSENESYEYIGERIGRTIRQRYSEDKSYETQAFFGWIGRRVMVQVCPETDFSLDRHFERAAEEKREMLVRLENIRKLLERGVEGELTPESVKQFMYEATRVPSLLAAESPLQLYVGEDFSWNGYSFGINYTYALENCYLPEWYERTRENLLKELEPITERAGQFETSYFRFIKDKAVAEGYAHAEEQKDEVMAHLPEIVRLPEAEVHRRYLSAKADIYGVSKFNSTMDLNDDPTGMYSGDFNYREFRALSVAEHDAWSMISIGRNADLYERLRWYEFTEEQRLLGIEPLFFGFRYSEDLAQAYLSQEMNSFRQRMADLTVLGRERDRIAGIVSGEFSLPQTPADLIRNADIHLARLRADEPSEGINHRIKALVEVRQILDSLISQGMLDESCY